MINATKTSTYDTSVLLHNELGELASYLLRLQREVDALSEKRNDAVSKAMLPMIGVMRQSIASDAGLLLDFIGNLLGSYDRALEGTDAYLGTAADLEKACTRLQQQSHALGRLVQELAQHGEVVGTNILLRGGVFACAYPRTPKRA